MSNSAGHGNTQSIARVASEFGQTFDQWTKRDPLGGIGWSTPIRELDGANSMSWTNLVGSLLGSAAFPHPLSSFSLSSSGTYSSQHTVHVRVAYSNSFLYWEIGPGTALHNVGGVADNMYALLAGNIGVALPFLALIKLASGGLGISVVTLTVGTNAIVRQNDILSLSYRKNSAGGGSVDLAIMVNGVVKATGTDASSPYDIATLPGKFGLYGDLIQAIFTSDMGHHLQEWWVTDGWQTFEQTPSVYPELQRSLRLTFMDRQRFTTATQPKIKAIVGGLTKCRWTYKRIGGCATLSAEFRYPDDDDPVAASFRAPTHADWASGNWLGGDVILSLPFTALEADPNVALTAKPDAVWRGRVTKLKLDTDTRVVKVTAEGLFSAMRERVVGERDYDDTVRAIIIDVISSTAKSATLDTAYRYNPAKIVGLQSALDLRVKLEVRAQTVKSILDKLSAYLPDGVVWGVDRDGEFFLDQQLDGWTVGHDGNGVLTFDATRDGVDFDLGIDVGRVRTIVNVIGSEDKAGGTTAKTSLAGRVYGRAEAERASELYGERAEIHTDSGIEEAGLAFKVALTSLKGAVAPRITAKLRVANPFRGLRSLYQSLTVSAPRVMVRDSSEAEKKLRFYDDVPSFSAKEEGSSGAGLAFPLSVSEQNLERSWLVHCALKFDLAHPGVAGQDAFVFGRPDDALGGLGWGSLWWQFNSGNLFWQFTPITGGISFINTGINVPIAGPGTVVDFTVWRDASGTFRFYDGNTLTATSALPATTMKTGPVGAWRWFFNGISVTNYIDGDVSARHFWCFDAVPLQALKSAAFSPVQDFIARNAGGPLHRNDAHGLLTYIPLREQWSVDTYAGVTGNPSLSVPMALIAPSLDTKSAAPGTPDGDDFDGTPSGLTVGTEKKWGGPWVFNAERVSYTYDADSGTLTRDFVLGDFPLDGMATLARVQAQVEKLGDILKRVGKSI